MQREVDARCELSLPVRGGNATANVGRSGTIQAPTSQSEPALKATLPVLERRTRLLFVASAEDAPPPMPGQSTVVLDPAWTPDPGDRSDVVSIRPWFAAGLEAHNLFDESLGLLDRWGAATAAADRLLVEGVTYWFRVREPLWHWLHERLLWRYALAALEGDGPFEIGRGAGR